METLSLIIGMAPVLLLLDRPSFGGAVAPCLASLGSRSPLS
ncbi:hypothetical protein MMSP_4229 [Mycobacterium sp. 012931]|nr:hypothetical protein MMSP_4229 [Mycobacterium sp. 012931]